MAASTEPDLGTTTWSPRGVLLIVLRVLAAGVAMPLLSWAWRILSNIWGYNDSGTLTYLAYASPLLVLGYGLLAFAFRSRSR